MSSEIQFTMIIIDDKGEDITKANPLTAEQVEQIIRANDAGSVQKFLGELAEKTKEKFTLGEACCLALKTPLDMDKSQDPESIYKRGRLIRKIRKAAKDGIPIVLKAKQVEMIKSRVEKCFTDASFILSVNEMLDPKVADDGEDE